MKTNSDSTIPLASSPPPAGASNSLDELIAQQGVGESAKFENFLGRGKSLWTSDDEFEQFLAAVDAVGQEKD